MSDMSKLYRVYSAVHNEEVKQELTENRDLISEMNMSQMIQLDVVEVCEEIVEGLFEYGLELDETCDVVASVLEESAGGERNELRDGKITQIKEAFETVFGTVTDKAERNCEEEFLLYRKNKPLTEKWSERVSHEFGNKRLHEALIAEDRHQVKSSLIELISKVIEEKKDSSYLETDMKKRQENNEKARKDLAKGPQMKNPHFEEVSTLRQGWGDAYSAIYEKKLDPVGQEDGDVDNDGDEDSSDEYLKKRRKAIGKAMKKEEYEVTMADKKGNTKAYQNFKAGMKNKITGKPLYKAGKGVEESRNPGETPHKEEVTFSKEELARIEKIVNSWED